MILRTLCPVLLIIFATSLACGQSLQIRAGANYSTVTGEDLKFHPGFYGGIQKDLPLANKRITFQPGIFYSRQSTQTEAHRYTFHYIQVPAMVNFKIGENGGILLGPQAGLLFHATNKARIGNDSNTPATSRYNSIALSLGAGPYVQASDRLRVELRCMVDVLSIGVSGSDNHMVLFQLGLAWAVKKTEAE